MGDLKCCEKTIVMVYYTEDRFLTMMSMDLAYIMVKVVKLFDLVVNIYIRNLARGSPMPSA